MKAATSAKRSKLPLKERSKGVSDLLKDQVQVSCCAAINIASWLCVVSEASESLH